MSPPVWVVTPGVTSSCLSFYHSLGSLLAPFGSLLVPFCFLLASLGPPLLVTPGVTAGFGGDTWCHLFFSIFLPFLWLPLAPHPLREVGQLPLREVGLPPSREAGKLPLREVGQLPLFLGGVWEVALGALGVAVGLLRPASLKGGHLRQHPLREVGQLPLREVGLLRATSLKGSRLRRPASPVGFLLAPFGSLVAPFCFLLASLGHPSVGDTWCHRRFWW